MGYRILMINDHINFGGGGDAAFQLERQSYEEAGHEVYTFSQEVIKPPKLSGMDFVYEENRLKIVRKAEKFLFHPGLYSSLKRLLNEVKPDVISVHLVSKYPLSVYTALGGYRVIQTLHGPSLFCATSWGCVKKDGRSCALGVGFKCLKNGCTSLLTFPLHILLHRTVTPVVKRTVTSYIGPSRQISATSDALGFKPVEYVRYAIDPGFCSSSVVTHDGPPTVLFVGAVDVVKGPHILLESFRVVKRSVPDAKLIFAGRGRMLPELRKSADLLGLSADVEFKGFVEHDKLKEVLKHAHVLAVPSIWKEQFALVGPEALALGIPCVGSNIGGIPEWLHDEEWGFLVPPRDVKALAEKLTKLLLDKELRMQFGTRGRAFVLSMFNPDEYKLKHLHVIDKCMSA
jgi:glycosyltransferase involved in cell wall biosynthesis